MTPRSQKGGLPRIGVSIPWELHRDLQDLLPHGQKSHIFRKLTQQLIECLKETSSERRALFVHCLLNDTLHLRDWIRHVDFESIKAAIHGTTPHAAAQYHPTDTQEERIPRDISLQPETGDTSPECFGGEKEEGG